MGIALVVPVNAYTGEAQPSKTELLGLTVLELLDEGLKNNPDLTLNPVIDEAAGCVMYSRTGIRDSLVALIDRSESTETLASIEASVVALTGAEPATVAVFTTEVLSLLRTTLAGRADVFLEEILAEATESLGIAEARGPMWARQLARRAARQLRPAPTEDLQSLPEGIHVLAVNFKAKKKADFQGFEGFDGSLGSLFVLYRIPARLLDPWPDELVDEATSFIAKSLAQSPSLKRRYRRIIPCHDLGESDNIHADYLLTLALTRQSWRQTSDRRTEEKAPEEILMGDRSKSASDKREETKVLEVTLVIEEALQTLPAGKELWQSEKTVNRYRDELQRRAVEDETVTTRGENWIVRKSTVEQGIMELLSRQARMDLARLR